MPRSEMKVDVPRNAIIVGMARSGTSLAATLFARHGYFVTAAPEDELRPGDEHNPFGYWEAAALVECNAQLLKRAGYPHHNTWFYPAIHDDAIAAIEYLETDPAHVALVESYRSRAPWVWKDPRLCITLPYWWKMMEPQSTCVLLMRRSPESVYWSFRRLGWVGSGKHARAEVIAKVRQHTLAAQTAVNRLNIPHIVVEYEELVADPEQVAARVGRLFNVEIRPASIVQRSLDHSAVSRRVPALVRRLLSRLPGRLTRGVKSLLPRSVLRLLLPEQRFLPKKSPPGRNRDLR